MADTNFFKEFYWVLQVLVVGVKFDFTQCLFVIASASKVFHFERLRDCRAQMHSLAMRNLERTFVNLVTLTPVYIRTSMERIVKQKFQISLEFHKLYEKFLNFCKNSENSSKFFTKVILVSFYSVFWY